MSELERVAKSAAPQRCWSCEGPGELLFESETDRLFGSPLAKASEHDGRHGVAAQPGRTWRPTVDVIIVEWKSGELLRHCLVSLAAAPQEGWQVGNVILVLNSPRQDEAELEALGLPIRLIGNESNRGFAAACNEAVAGSDAELLLFLNPDTQLAADSLEKATERFVLDPDGALAVVGVRMIDDLGETVRTCARIPSFWNVLVSILRLDHALPALFQGVVLRDWPHDTDRDVEHVIGAFFLVRRRVFEALRAFDERFFVYLEDLDLSARVREAGLREHFVATTRVRHRGGGRAGSTDAQRLYFSRQSRLRYCRKHFGATAAVLVALVSLTLEPAIRLPVLFWRGGLGNLREDAHAWKRMAADFVRRPRWLLNGE